jgi:hypothetical protein
MSEAGWKASEPSFLVGDAAGCVGEVHASGAVSGSSQMGGEGSATRPAGGWTIRP